MPKYIADLRAEEVERLREAREVVRGMVDRIKPVEAQADIIGALGLDTKLVSVSRPIDSTSRNVPRT